MLILTSADAKYPPPPLAIVSTSTLVLVLVKKLLRFSLVRLLLV